MRYKEFKDLDKVIEESKSHAVLIFKHSNICGVSAFAKDQLDQVTGEIYIIVIQENRELSNMIATTLKIVHESPQLLILKDGKVADALDHYEITKEKVKDLMA